MLPKELRAAVNNLPLESHLVLGETHMCCEHHLNCIEARVVGLGYQLLFNSSRGTFYNFRKEVLETWLGFDATAPRGDTKGKWLQSCATSQPTGATDFLTFLLLMKKTKARNLLERFHDYHEDILRFFHDFDVPFDNNPFERNIRMAKVKQKISKGFRTFTGARYFARTRSFVSTAQKQHISILDALKDLFGDNQIQLQLVRAAE